MAAVEEQHPEEYKEELMERAAVVGAAETVVDEGP